MTADDASASALQFTVDTAGDVGDCYPFWRVANWNRPYRLLEPGSIEALRRHAPFVDALNCVYLLGGRDPEHNCWFLGVHPDGTVRTDFDGLIAQLQASLDYGYTPWIVLDNVPYNMSDPPDENMYGNTAPPADEGVWHKYVRAAIEAMVDAFGRERVGSWWFRVGTEPDLLPGHWTGTKEQYFSHYDHTADAVTSVLPDALIGPGNILNPVEGEYGIIVRDQWGLDIIDHVATGRNACTGGTGAPMRWFSCSWYGRVSVPLSMFDKAMGMMRKRLRRYDHLADLPMIVGEFAVLHDENGKRLYSGDTTEWSASFYAGIADRVYAHGVQQVYEWSHATDGLLHPRGQVIEMLRRMVGGRRLAVERTGQSASDCGLVACRKDGDLFLLVYNHGTDREPKVNQDMRLVLQAPGTPDGDRRLTEWTVDADHAVWAYAFEADCEAAGVEPLPEAGRYEGGIGHLYGEPGHAVWNESRDKYAELAVLRTTRDAEPVSAENGRLTLDLPMQGHSVRLIRISRAP